jgi:hypothetical protein
MHRKLIYGLFICMFAFLATNASAQYWGDEGDFEYTGDDGVITITGYIGAGGAIVIPDTVIGFPVVSIGNNAFRENTIITGVTIPEGITSIGASAFRDCTGLTSATLPDSLESIGGSAFASSGLTSVTIPEAVTVISSSLFSGCTDLTSVTLSDNATEIGTSAFSGCESLASITIPASVITIKNTAFRDCFSLTSVNIPELVDSIHYSSFSNCSDLTSITVDAANASFTSVDGVLYNDDVTTLVICPAGKSGTLTIPDGVTLIGRDSCKLSALSGVTIPASVATIDRTAFFLSGLETVTIPATVSLIKAQAFRGSPNLTSITVEEPNAVYTSVDGVLYNEAQDTLIQYPTGRTGTATIPSGVTTIPAHAFSEASALTSVVFSDTVSSINTNFAFGTPTITSYVVDAANPDFSSLDGVIYNKDQTTLVLAPKGIAGHFTIPDGVTTLADSSFGACELLTSVTIPDSVITLAGGWASGPFTNCIGLTSVIIPDSVTDIAGPSFYGCKSLTSMHIGSGAINIGSGLAWECTSLETITVDPANASFTSIDGVMYDKLATRLMYFPLARAGAFTVPDGVISIDSSALRAAHFITEITLPGSVTTLGNYCFAPMNSLATVNMVEGLETIGRGSLRYAPNLTSVTIPASVTGIVKDAFLNNWRMSSAYFLGNAPVMGTNVFSGLAADFHICYPDDAFGFTRPWLGYRAYPVSICDDPDGDLDGDTIVNYLDNCVDIPNVDQADADIDYIGDSCDNCPDFAGHSQKDVDDDGEGDICDDGTIYGTFSGAGAANINVNLYQVSCGASSLVDTYKTAGDGYYAFANRADTVYEIIPVMWLYTFTPESARVDTFFYPENMIFDFTTEAAF